MLTGCVRYLGPSLIVLALFVSGCSSNDSGDSDDGTDNGDRGETKPLFDPARADELAHAMMLQPSDLPGTGWEVVATDQFDDSGDSEDDDFEKLAAGIPECKGLSELAKLGQLLGDDEDKLPAGRAKVEIERAGELFTLPTNIEFEVEIEETVTEVQGTWGIAKGLFESKDVTECLPALMEAAVVGEVPDDSVQIKMDSAKPSAKAPGDGVAMAFAMNLKAGQIFDLDMTMELYIWPRSNAGATLMLLRDPETMTKEDVQKIVEAADAKIRAAAK